MEEPLRSVRPELERRWAELVARTGLPSGLGAELVERWSEPHRGYHDELHLAVVVARVDELLDAVDVPDPDAVRLAAWFHDAVYDPTDPRSDEERSADLARARLAPWLDPARVDEVARLVLTTVGHDADDLSAVVLADADLAILASDDEAYGGYVSGVRREYAHLDDETFRVGRIGVLEHLLDIPRLFRAPGSDGREARARANLRRELDGLRRDPTEPA